MRITEGMIASNVLHNLQFGQERLARLQQQASSGLKLDAPGDDPVAAQEVLGLKGSLSEGEQYGRNITTGNAWLSQADSAMDQMGNVVTRLQEIAVEMATGTADAAGRLDAASEVKQLKNQLVQLGNSQVAGKYIFGGFANDKPPFDATMNTTPGDPLNGTAAGTFTGTDDAVTMEVGQGSRVAISYSGGELLRGGTPPGTSGVDIVATMDKLLTSLSTNDVSGIQGAIPDLGASLTRITSARADVGSRISRVASASANLDSAKVTLNKAVSDRQDADYLSVLSDLSSQQTAFQAALASAGKISQLSLLDYLK